MLFCFLRRKHAADAFELPDLQGRILFGGEMRCWWDGHVGPRCRAPVAQAARGSRRFLALHLQAVRSGARRSRVPMFPPIGEECNQFNTSNPIAMASNLVANITQKKLKVPEVQHPRCCGQDRPDGRRLEDIPTKRGS